MKKEENFYELLKVDRKATVSEIVTAYHAARNAFSKDSLAAYSLFTADEAEDVLKKLEEAYLTLSNLDRKRDYDRHLVIETAKPHSTATPTAPSAATTAPLSGTPASVFSAQAQALAAPIPSTTPPAPAPAHSNGNVNGAWLKVSREQSGMSIEDVSRLTKIPLSTLKAIENDDLKKLPARVYLQGFVSNLLKVYKIDPKTTKTYLETIDRLLKPTPVS